MRDEYSRQYIDDHGNVTGFNTERFARMNKGYRKFRNHSNGLGVLNFIKLRIRANKNNWDLLIRVFHLILAGSKWLDRDSLKGRLYKRIVMLGPEQKRNSGALVLPLNVDLSDYSEKVVVPIDLIKAALAKSDYIAALNRCICRDAEDCKNYPHDLACLFLGRGGEHVVDSGIATRVTYEQACERVDRAAELGLVGQAVWVEVEQFIWGIRNDELDQFLEFCFCCPCCCVTMNLARNASATRDIRDRFHPAGWTAVPDRSKCTGCGACLTVNCPQEALSIGDEGTIEINQNYCTGCGICKARCPQGAIRIRQTMPMRSDIKEYYREEFSLELDMFD